MSFIHMASQSTKIAGLPFIPKKYSVIERGGKAYVTTKGRKKYKTPAKVRRKMATAARRVKFPLLTIGAISVPVFGAVTHAGGVSRLASADGFKKFGSYLVSRYTGFYPIDGSFNFARLGEGLAPLLAVFALNRSGVLKPVNSKLAKMRIPLRLS